MIPFKLVPIHVDRNVSKSEYKNLGSTHLAVTSVFYTFQGEGPFGGYPALFIRLAGCNLGAKKDCPFCDAAFEVEFSDTYSIASLADTILELTHHRPALIVVTGGEPLLQVDAINALMQLPSLVNYKTWQLETNGMYLKSKTYIDPRMHIVVSPKIPHTRETYAPIPTHFKGRQNLYLKYVVTADHTSPYFSIPDDALTANVPVYVSAMAVYKRSLVEGEVANIWDDTLIDRNATSQNYKYAAALALEKNLLVSYQTHLFGVQA